MHAIVRRRLLQGAVAVAAGAASAACGPDNPESGSGPSGSRPERTGKKVTSLTMGVNGAKWYNDAFGLWDPYKNRPDPDVVEKVKASGIGLVRYPGGTSSNLFDWKKAVGPQASRGHQVEGKKGAQVDSRYGPDEYMRFIAETGATPQIMAPFVGSTPQDIADWVSYMNAPRHTEWGSLRAKHGHPEPYGVRYWEIGNELFGKFQRYWMSDDDEKALRQYAFGGTQQQKHQPVGTPTDHRPAAGISSGKPLQSFTVRYPPVVPKSQSVHVGDTTWHEIEDLTSAGPHDRVYSLEPASGTIRFGDGRQGKVPLKGLHITATYDSGPHAGYVDYYAAMKKADPDIDVLACWALIGSGKLADGTSFPRLMAEHGHAHDYDGLAIHPYTNFKRDLHIKRFPDKKSGHDYQMLGETASVKMVHDLQAEVSRYGKEDAYVAVTESGALFFGDVKHASDAYPEFSYAMSHVLYMASQWLHFTDLGVRWTVGNDLIGEKQGLSRFLFGGEPDFERSPEAIVREQLRDFFHNGGHVVDCSLRKNVRVSTRDTPLGSSYEALVSTAAVGKDGSLRVVVVNRSPEEKVTTEVDLGGFRHTGVVHVSTVAGASYDAAPSPRHPDAVKIATSRSTARSTSPSWTFGPHSVTLLTFSAAR